ncbi:MAG TPA: hydroxyisourate hydrolase [Bryobacteraceae bacterium]|jgi:5-hydroxyisourate hydrolase|nr:hydroxyisourate hydrolase [Bryobacteraceae bacterium]
MNGISTHVLNTAKGQPAQGVRVTAERLSSDGNFVAAGEGITDVNGRIPQLLGSGAALEAGVYRLTFHAGDYFGDNAAFYSEITVQFLVRDPSTHYHVPLLLSPYGYTTYRGS